MCVCFLVHDHDYRCLWRREENTTSLGARVAGGCKPTEVGSRKESQALCKNNTSS